MPEGDHDQRSEVLKLRPEQKGRTFGDHLGGRPAPPTERGALHGLNPSDAEQRIGNLTRLGRDVERSSVLGPCHRVSGCRRPKVKTRASADLAPAGSEAVKNPTDRIDLSERITIVAAVDPHEQDPALRIARSYPGKPRLHPFREAIPAHSPPAFVAVTTRLPQRAVRIDGLVDRPRAPLQATDLFRLKLPLRKTIVDTVQPRPHTLSIAIWVHQLLNVAERRSPWAPERQVR
jgi:hypothetical protein